MATPYQELSAVLGSPRPPHSEVAGEPTLHGAGAEFAKVERLLGLPGAERGTSNPDGLAPNLEYFFRQVAKLGELAMKVDEIVANLALTHCTIASRLEDAGSPLDAATRDVTTLTGRLSNIANTSGGDYNSLSRLVCQASDCTGKAATSGEAARLTWDRLNRVSRVLGTSLNSARIYTQGLVEFSEAYSGLGGPTVGSMADEIGVPGVVLRDGAVGLARDVTDGANSTRAAIGHATTAMNQQPG
jgi:hypothetical protein